MALIIRSRVIKPKTIAPCADCKDRKINCHSQCTKYTEWKNAYIERKNAIKKSMQRIADVETYEITQKQKNMKASRRR